MHQLQQKKKRREASISILRAWFSYCTQLWYEPTVQSQFANSWKKIFGNFLGRKRERERDSDAHALIWNVQYCASTMHNKLKYENTACKRSRSRFFFWITLYYNILHCCERVRVGLCVNCFFYHYIQKNHTRVQNRRKMCFTTEMIEAVGFGSVNRDFRLNFAFLSWFCWTWKAKIQAKREAESSQCSEMDWCIWQRKTTKQNKNFIYRNNRSSVQI